MVSAEKMILIFGNFVLCQNVFALNLRREFDSDINFSEKIMEVIAVTYAPKTSTINMIFTSGSYTDLMDTIVKETSDMKETATLLESAESMGETGGRFWNVIFIDSFNGFLKVYKKMSTELFAFHGFYMIVLTDGPFPDIEEIFELLWAKQIYNVALLFVEDSIVKALSFNPFGPKSCDEVKIVERTNFSYLFDQKLKDLKSCPITVHAPEWPPFVYKTNVNEIKGRDYDVIKAMSDVLNFTLDFTVLTELASWGVLFENGTVTGAMKNLLNYQADIIIGDYYLRPIRKKFMDASNEYYKADVVFVIPPGRKLVSFEKLLQPFNRTVWFLFIATLIFAFLCIYLINRRVNGAFGRNIIALMFKILSIAFAVSLPRQPRNSFVRLLLMTFMLFCLVLAALYQGLLYKFLQTDSTLKEAQSIDEMIARNYSFYSYDSMFEVIQSENRITQRLIEMKYDEFKPMMKKLRSSSFDGTMVSGLNEILLINQQHEYNYTFKFCKERVMGISIVMYFRKNFFLVPAINEVIRNLVSGGIIDFWHYRYIDEKYLSGKEDQSEPKVMTIDHLIGCFQLWACGCCIAAMSFLFELIYFHYAMKPADEQPFKFVN